MINKKRFLIFVLVISAMLSLALTVSAEGGTFSAENVTAAPGEEVTVDITLSGNPGVSAIALNVEYSDKLELLSADDGGLLGDKTHGNDLSANPYKFTWNNYDSNKTGNGVVATLTFKVSDAAAIGDALEISIDAYDGWNYDLDPVSFNSVDGAITVICPHTDTENKPMEPAKCNAIGYTAGVFCNGCQTYLSGHKEIPATEKHVDADGVYARDDSEHYYECKDCGAKFDNATHIMSSATCSAKSKCAKCGYETGEIDPDKHRGGWSTCSSLAKCIDCGTEYGEFDPYYHEAYVGGWNITGTTHYHVCICGESFDEEAHSGGTATCTAKAKCVECEAEYGELNTENHVETEIKDAVAATCGKDGYSGDIYCKACGVKTKDGETVKATGAHSGGTATCVAKAKCEVCDAEYGEIDPANHGETVVKDDAAATCGKDGYSGDTYCKACDVKLKDGEVVKATGAHSGGTATCVAKAKCVVCGAEYGEIDPAKHVENVVKDAVTATCGKAGYTGDTYCKSCNAKLATGTAVAATGKHVDADGKWENDGNGHYHTCGTCGAKFDQAAHAGGVATCVAKAKCSVCNVEYGNVDPAKHGENVIKDAVAGTCGKDGYTGDTYCKDCNVKLKTGSVVKATGAHVDNDEKWEHDETTHYHTCGVCEAIFDKAEHEGGEAGCASKAKCSVCEAEYGEIAPAKHGETEVRNAKEAICITAGYTGDTYCKDCGSKLSEGSEIPATEVHVDEDEDDTCDQCSKNLKKFPFWIIILILVLLGAGGGVCYYLKIKSILKF
jgi:hypothetical protein